MTLTLSRRIPRDGNLILAYIGGLVLLALIVVATAAPVLAPYDPSKLVGLPFEKPSPTHRLGTNDVGQDIFSELIFGARVSLLIGLTAAVIALVVGSSVGLTAGFVGGATDSMLMRLVDVALLIPLLPLLVLLAAYLGQSIAALIVVIGLLSWARMARVIRAQALSVVGRDFVISARALGAGGLHIVSRHVLPAVLPHMAAQFVLVVSTAILLEATLSFLGLGDPTQKSWGSMLYYAQARNAFLTGAWVWWVLPPGLLIAVTVFAFALLTFAIERD